MSNNTPDYENDLVFAPASADVRTSRIEKQLEIAVKALEVYADSRTWDCCCRNQCAYVDGFEASEALRKINELDK